MNSNIEDNWGWKNWGYRHWLRGPEALEYTDDVFDEPVMIAQEEPGWFSARLARVLAAQVAALVFKGANRLDDDDAKLKRLHALCLDIDSLRRGDHGLRRLAPTSLFVTPCNSASPPDIRPLSAITKTSLADSQCAPSAEGGGKSE